MDCPPLFRRFLLTVNTQCQRTDCCFPDQNLYHHHQYQFEDIQEWVHLNNSLSGSVQEALGENESILKLNAENLTLLDLPKSTVHCDILYLFNDCNKFYLLLFEHLLWQWLSYVSETILFYIHLWTKYFKCA